MIIGPSESVEVTVVIHWFLANVAHSRMARTASDPVATIHFDEFRLTVVTTPDVGFAQLLF